MHINQMKHNKLENIGVKSYKNPTSFFRCGARELLYSSDTAVRKSSQTIHIIATARKCVCPEATQLASLIKSVLQDTGPLGVFKDESWHCHMFWPTLLTTCSITKPNGVIIVFQVNSMTLAPRSLLLPQNVMSHSAPHLST